MRRHTHIPSYYTPCDKSYGVECSKVEHFAKWPEKWPLCQLRVPWSVFAYTYIYYYFINLIGKVATFLATCHFSLELQRKVGVPFWPLWPLFWPLGTFYTISGHFGTFYTIEAVYKKCYKTPKWPVLKRFWPLFWPLFGTFYIINGTFYTISGHFYALSEKPIPPVKRI